MGPYYINKGKIGKPLTDSSLKLRYGEVWSKTSHRHSHTHIIHTLSMSRFFIENSVEVFLSGQGDDVCEKMTFFST